MIDMDVVLIALIIFQVVLLFVHSLAQRREIGRLNRRLSALGTEIGLLKAKARRPEKAPAEVHMPVPAYPSILAEFPESGPLDLSFLNCRSNPADRQFLSPSWI
jgi:hypothetical protein